MPRNLRTSLVKEQFANEGAEPKAKESDPESLLEFCLEPIYRGP